MHLWDGKFSYLFMEFSSVLKDHTYFFLNIRTPTPSSNLPQTIAHIMQQQQQQQQQPGENNNNMRSIAQSPGN